MKLVTPTKILWVPLKYVRGPPLSPLHIPIFKNTYYYRKIGFGKGQLISKGHFVFFNSSKKRTKNRLGQKSKFSSSFLGRIEDTKISFRN